MAIVIRRRVACLVCGWVFPVAHQAHARIADVDTAAKRHATDCQRPRLRWTAACSDCDWTYANVVKTDVAKQASRHRRQCAVQAQAVLA